MALGEWFVKDDGDSGFSLVAVTWIVLLLSIMASGVLALTLSTKKSIDTLETLERDRLLVESALDVFMHRYFYSEVEQVYQNGEVALEGHRVDVSVSYESGKININRANQPLLSAMFAVVGESVEQSKKLAAAIHDWHDADDFTQPDGAENIEYEEAGLTGPRNGPFESVGEIKSVIGMTDKLYRCILPLITVSSLANAVEVQFASEPVRTVLSWAYNESWEGAEWDDPANIENKNSVVGANNSLSGRSMFLTFVIDSNPQKTYFTIVRFGTTAARNVNYKRLAPLRLVGDFLSAESCVN